jgi:hypothetical protein
VKGAARAAASKAGMMAARVEAVVRARAVAAVMVRARAEV